MSIGVYIDMEMPGNCDKCLYSSWSNFYQIYVCNAIRKNEPVLFDKKQVKSTDIVRSGRADNCPLVPVPKHGRLIDADALIADVRAHSESYFADDFAHEWVDVAPTIIPASEDGE